MRGLCKRATEIIEASCHPEFISGSYYQAVNTSVGKMLKQVQHCMIQRIIFNSAYPCDSGPKAGMTIFCLRISLDKITVYC